MKSLLLLSLVLGLSTSAFAGKVQLQKDISSLGENQAVLNRAKALDPQNKVSIVQKRAVDRNSRFELGLDGGLIGGGDSYLNSQILGGSLGFHFTPNWSVAVRYTSYSNNLTAEGKAFYDAIKQPGPYMGGGARPPGVDSPYSTTMLMLNWYPIYGKMNVFTWIPHFDVYFLAGYGKTNTQFVNMADTLSAGGGVGIWLTNTFTLRLEARYQTYSDMPYMYAKSEETRRLDTLVGQASLGILL